MDLVNTTPLACEVAVAPAPDDPETRMGVVSAKATFIIDASGRLELDDEDPHPLFAADEKTPLGVLPNDQPVRRGPELEVMVLAAAYAPGARPVTALTVTLSVGSRSRSIRVVGDRRWVRGPDGWVLTDPTPFVRMPLVWERAFGGTAEVWLDGASTTEVMHEMNPRGRGFDPTARIEGLAKHLYVADGFPRTAYERWAPNLEAPEMPIVGPSDAPDPICFAPTPLDIGVQLRELGAALTATGAGRPYLFEVGTRRAHPEWVLERAPLGQPVELTNCRPDGDLRFTLPAITPTMDYVLGDRSGTRALTPQVLVLLPEERRFYVVYRHFFMMRAGESDERSIRIRYE